MNSRLATERHARVDHALLGLSNADYLVDRYSERKLGLLAAMTARPRDILCTKGTAAAGDSRVAAGLRGASPAEGSGEVWAAGEGKPSPRTTSFYRSS